MEDKSRRLRPISQRIRPPQSPSDPTSPQPSTSSPASRQSLTPMIASGAAILMLGMLLILSRLGQSASAQALQPTGAPAFQTVVVLASPTPTPRPTCNSATAYLSALDEQEQRLRYDAAIATAERALDDRSLCAADRPIVADRYVGANIEAIFAHPFSPEPSEQRDAVSQYIALKRAAAHYGASLPPPLQFADRAAHAGRFLLAKVIFDDAIYSGDFQRQDMPRVQAYVSNLYNLGYYWTQRKDSPSYQEGMAFLSTSHHLAVANKTGQAEAWGRLKELLGTDERRWPAPIDTPLLPAQ